MDAAKFVANLRLLHGLLFCAENNFTLTPVREENLRMLREEFLTKLPSLYPVTSAKVAEFIVLYTRNVVRMHGYNKVLDVIMSWGNMRM